MTPQEYCAQKARASGSSFYYSFKFLTPQRRAAITALYAFCREVDDVVDGCKDVSVAQTKLAWWRQEVMRMQQGQATHPVTKALAPFQTEFGIATRDLNEIIDGMQMDLEQNRYLDFAGLKLYCYRVAGVVGIIAAKIFGYRSEQTLAYADRLGLALQLTNIIRDVGEDARLGRVYIPTEDLQQFNLSVQQIIRLEDSENFRRLMRFQAERAFAQYRAAYELLPAIDRKSQKVGLIMGSIYSDLLAVLKQQDFAVLNQRTSLTPRRKLAIALRVYLTGRPLPI